MSHMLIDRLIDELGYEHVTAESHDAFVSAPGMNVLFLPGDAATVKDATDVAVVLPELVKVFAGKLRPGVVTDTYGAGKELKRYYGFAAFPSLVFVRGGDYVGTITRIQDWADYITVIQNLLVTSPKRPPGFKIDVVTA